MKAKAIRFFVESFLFVAATLAIAPAPSMAMGDKVGEFMPLTAVHWGDVVSAAGLLLDFRPAAQAPRR